MSTVQEKVMMNPNDTTVLLIDHPMWITLSSPTLCEERNFGMR